jgi:quinol-cytochrome oxidoreductase complex cytochrome b subunit
MAPNSNNTELKQNNVRKIIVHIFLPFYSMLNNITRQKMAFIVCSMVGGILAILPLPFFSEIRLVGLLLARLRIRLRAQTDI